ncbi:MAG: glutaminyl-peptide cyclotransferase [Verrucomicrobia bacterium]|nr:glutaminyl-peptide cyclotransferase [Verrucomicrobiota bacterium]
MKTPLCLLSLAGLGLLTSPVLAQTDAPYKVLDTTQLMGTGRIDYVYADNDGRRVYVPRGGNTFVFDLDSHKYLGAITNIGGHGVAIDTASHHGFASGSKIGMFDTETMQKTKDIDVQGRPDGILLEPFTGKVFIFSHAAPSITMIDPKDGTVTGTIDVGGAMEQAQSDGQGKLYVDVENEKKIAVVDLKAMKLVTKYDLGDGAGEPGGLGFDVKNHILFAMCARPNVCVVVNADDGKVLTTLPIGSGTDGGGFNPNTMEAFSSQRDGTLTIIKESSPTSFAVEQTVQTKPGCKTCSLDSKNNRIVLICTERAPQGTATPAENPPGGPRRGGRNRGGPGYLDLVFVGR